MSKKDLKSTAALYKRIEQYFIRGDQASGKVAYLKLKQQFRVMFILSLFGAIGSFVALVLHGILLPLPILFVFVVLIGFRFKLHFCLRAMTFIIFTYLPLKYFSGSHVLFAPTGIMFANVQVLIQTQSRYLAIIHLVIQTLVLQIYGTQGIMDQLKTMSSDEIAATVQSALNICLFSTTLNLLAVDKFHSYLSTLLRKIGALTDDLSKANNRLNSQNLKLQNNLEMKDVFIYTFSHELKNALNGLLGNLTLAYDSASKDSQVVQFLSSAKVCGEVIKNFVHNILDSGKLENRNLEVSPERKDVMSFMQNVWAICGRIIQNKRLGGSLEIDKDVPRYLELDEQRMIQIILNLTSNAVKFTEKGQVRIRVSWETTAISDLPSQSQKVSLYHGPSKELLETIDGSSSNTRRFHFATERPKKFLTNSHSLQLNLSKWHWNPDEALSSTISEGSKGILKIQVLDSGCGVSPENQSKLFQKFSQVNQEANQRKVGTGLGLWICKELANRLDGDIKVLSAVGVGSIFELIVQTEISYFNEKPPIPLQNSNGLVATYNWQQGITSPMKILIADDDNFNMELMKNYLTRFDIDYLCAYDGEEAVSLFKAHYKEIAFVITDNFMPKKTGIEAALEIADFLEEKRRPKIPIMCVSGDVKVHVGEKGITSVIQKPINFDRLKQELMLIYPQVASARES